MKRTTLLSSLFVLAAASAFAGAAVIDGFSIKRTPKVGDVVKYTVKGSFEVQGMEVGLESKSSDSVTKVDGDKITIESKQYDTKVILNGSEQAQPEATVSGVENIAGEPLEFLGDSAKPEMFRSANLMALIYPDKEVKVGDSWTHEGKANDKGAVDTKSEFKLVGEEKIGKHDSLKIEVKSKETKGDTPGSVDSTVWVEKGTGIVVKMVSKLKDVTFPGAPFTLTGTITKSIID